MTNTDTNIITATIASHGLFRVHADHLAATIDATEGTSTAALHTRIADLVGAFDYTDLDRASALVVLSYLTGGCAD